MTQRSKKKKKVQKRIKVFAIGDHPFVPSGVGHQCKLIYKALVDSGKFEVFCLGGMITDEQHGVSTVSGYGDLWKILPTNGYGDPNLIRSILSQEQPDMLWFMTDPRQFIWLWQMEDEIRPHIPMIYYHVWDNYPLPYFNKDFYDSTDAIISISKLTHDIVTKVGDEKIYKKYLPHSVDTNVFKPLDKKELQEIVKKTVDMPPALIEKPFKVFFNSRNARRKQTGSLIYWFGKFAEKVGKENVLLIMHTDPKDPHGQDLIALIKRWDLQNSVVLSAEKQPSESMNVLYNFCDCTISISDAEGFGLSMLESLSAGSPIIATVTGGMQDQLFDNDGNAYGIGLEPVSKALIGSQDCPYIYEDRLNENQVVGALEQMYNMTPEQREEWGQKGRARVLRDFNYENFNKEWVKIMLEVHKKYGSWPNREYRAWEFKEIE